MESLTTIKICRQACQRVILELQKVEQPELKDRILNKLKDAIKEFNLVIDGTMILDHNTEIKRITKWAEELKAQDVHEFDFLDLVCNFDYPDKVAYDLLNEMKEARIIYKLPSHSYRLANNYNKAESELTKYVQAKLF